MVSWSSVSAIHGHGQTVVEPETNGPDFALVASIENTNMQTMILLRAHGNFDVVRFLLRLRETRVKDGSFKDMSNHYSRDGCL
jgi:hypothetical protein